jgi:hypothetical protein
MMQVLAMIILLCGFLALVPVSHAEEAQQQTFDGETIVVDKSRHNSKFSLKPGQVLVAARGETVISANTEGMNILVKIKTHEVQLGELSFPTNIHRFGCTESINPCSLVDSIEISVGNKPLFVPRSVFCALSDVYKAEIKIHRREAILILVGGFTVENYIVKIRFDAEHISYRNVASGMDKNNPSEETFYFETYLE